MTHIKILVFISFVFIGMSSNAQTDSLKYAVDGMKRMAEYNMVNGLNGNEIYNSGIVLFQRRWGPYDYALQKRTKLPDTLYFYFYSYSCSIKMWSDKNENYSRRDFRFPYHNTKDNIVVSLYTPYMKSESDKAKNRRDWDSTNRFVGYLSIANRYYTNMQQHFPDSLAAFKASVKSGSYDKYRPEISEEQRKFIVQANALTEGKKYFEALEKLNESIGVNPYAYPEAYYNAAILLEMLGNYPFAIYYMQKYLILAPDAVDARKSQDKIYEWELKLGL